MCRECGFTAQKWLGRCPSCNAWNTLIERKEQPYFAARSSPSETGAEIISLNALDSGNESRIRTGIGEFDRILGGGMVKGSAVLLGGPPGIGKSTLMLQLAEGLSANASVLYVSAEESAAQLKSRAVRLGVDSGKIFVLSENNVLEAIAAAEKQKADCLIIDSIQTVFNSEFPGSQGSLVQVKESAQSLVNLAKKKNITVFMLGHVTKDGEIAGPKVLEHLVDTVLYFEVEKQQSLRMLKVHKNRFGAVSEIAFFEMTSAGLREVKDSSEYFLEGITHGAPGSSLVSVMEGSRVIFLEVQSLVSKINFGFPKRMVTGYDYGRVSLLIALLENKIGIPFSGYDVFVNVVGGFKIQETSADLGILVALAGSFFKSCAKNKTLYIGEIGLTGEVRNVPNASERLSCAVKYGFDRVILPAKSAKSLESLGGNVEIMGVSTISEVISDLKQES